MTNYRVAIDAVIASFSDTIATTYVDSVTAAAAEVSADAYTAAITRLYQNSPLTSFSQMTATAENTIKISNIFKMMDECNAIAAADTSAISTLGATYGFTEEESICIYNMNRFKAVLDNMETIHRGTMQILADAYTVG